MQAIPYGTWWSPATPASHLSPLDPKTQAVASAAADNIQRVVSENAVVVVGRRGCCMCHVVKRLLIGHGVNPAVFDVDEDDEAAVIVELRKMVGEIGKDDQNITVVDSWPQFPVVFVGGKLFGGLERVMATHISGELVPVLKDAGALWL